MRFVVFGAGAVGGVVGGRLFEHDHEVLFIARGQHREALARDGLTLRCPSGSTTLPVPVVDGPDKVDWREHDVVLLAMKSQDTEPALRQLDACAPPSVAVVCLQNGVSNERAAMRRFSNVSGVCVICPAAHLEPGVVVARSAPVTAVLDIGRYPKGLNVTAEAVAAAFTSSTMESVARPDIMRWKYAKLLRNLGNAVDAICGPGERGSRLAHMARQEGEACLVAAGIDYASDAEDRARRADHLKIGEVSGQHRAGSSSWQSLARSQGSIEADFFNGEIVLLGRSHGVPTPVNELLRRLANQMARDRAAPGTISPDEVLGLLDQSEG